MEVGETKENAQIGKEELVQIIKVSIDENRDTSIFDPESVVITGECGGGVTWGMMRMVVGDEDIWGEKRVSWMMKERMMTKIKRKKDKEEKKRKEKEKKTRGTRGLTMTNEKF